MNTVMAINNNNVDWSVEGEGESVRLKLNRQSESFFPSAQELALSLEYRQKLRDRRQLLEQFFEQVGGA